MAMEHWRIMTLVLMDAQRNKYDFGMYSSGLDGVYEFQLGMTWFWNEGVKIKMTFSSRT